jgi:hypothetical protein
MLYPPEAFEPLVDTSWSELRARAAIRSIVEDADAAFRGPRLWTGDIGAALYAADCIDGASRYPIVDGC